ncbi:single-pass membrane and coiled-coil domain-containing protein 4 isoform 2-T2 [Hipposideros larvatus]
MLRLRPASTLGFPSHQPSGQRVPLTPIHLCLNPGSNYSPSPASSVCLYISLSSPKFKASSPVRKLKSHLYWKSVCLETIETAVPKVEEKFSTQEVLQLEQRSVSLPSEPSLDLPS